MRPPSLVLKTWLRQSRSSVDDPTVSDVDDLRVAQVERERLRTPGRRRKRPERREPAFVAGPARRSASGERRGTRTAAAVPAEANERCSPCRSDQQSRRPVPLPATSRPPARLLDQRLQVRDTLLEIAILLDLWPARRRGNGHGDSS